MSSYEVTRTTSIAADPARVHALIDDFHEWPAWSPWEGLDPDLQRTYSGSESGPGAHYAWKGNRKAGEGSMQITASSAERVDVDLTFLKPFKNQARIDFGIRPVPAGSDVTWRMTGELSGMAGLFGRVVSMDKLVGKDFEKGLAQLKQVAEAP